MDPGSMPPSEGLPSDGFRRATSEGGLPQARAPCILQTAFSRVLREKFTCSSIHMYCLEVAQLAEDSEGPARLGQLEKVAVPCCAFAFVYVHAPGKISGNIKQRWFIHLNEGGAKGTGLRPGWRGMSTSKPATLIYTTSTEPKTVDRSQLSHSDFHCLTSTSFINRYGGRSAEHNRHRARSWMGIGPGRVWVGDMLRGICVRGNRPESLLHQFVTMRRGGCGVCIHCTCFVGKFCRGTVLAELNPFSRIYLKQHRGLHKANQYLTNGELSDFRTNTMRLFR